MSELDTHDDQHRGTQMPDTETKDDQPTNEALPAIPEGILWGSPEMDTLMWERMEAAVRSSSKAGSRPETDTKDEG